MSYSKSSNLPIDFLPGIGKRTAKALKKLDISTIGQFKRTPEKILVELFGPSIRKFYIQPQYSYEPKSKLFDARRLARYFLLPKSA